MAHIPLVSPTHSGFLVLCAMKVERTPSTTLRPDHPSMGHAQILGSVTVNDQGIVADKMFSVALKSTAAFALCALASALPIAGSRTVEAFSITSRERVSSPLSCSSLKPDRRANAIQCSPSRSNSRTKPRWMSLSETRPAIGR